MGSLTLYEEKSNIDLNQLPRGILQGGGGEF